MYIHKYIQIFSLLTDPPFAKAIALPTPPAYSAGSCDTAKIRTVLIWSERMIHVPHLEAKKIINSV